MKFCAKCGNEMMDDAVVCVKCGCAVEEPQQPVACDTVTSKFNGLGLAALICGICAFLFNPLYLVSIVAIVLGIVGLATARNKSKTMAIVGLCLGGGTLVLSFIADVVLLILSYGFSFFSFFI